MLRNLYNKESGSNLVRSSSLNNDENAIMNENISLKSSVAVCNNCGVEYQVGFGSFCAECGIKL